MTYKAEQKGTFFLFFLVEEAHRPWAMQCGGVLPIAPIPLKVVKAGFNPSSFCTAIKDFSILVS